MNVELLVSVIVALGKWAPLGEPAPGGTESLPRFVGDGGWSAGFWPGPCHPEATTLDKSLNFWLHDPRASNSKASRMLVKDGPVGVVERGAGPSAHTLGQQADQVVPLLS